MLSRFKEKTTTGRGYVYDELPEHLKVQIIHIWDGLANEITEIRFRGSMDDFYGPVRQQLYREFGTFRLTAEVFRTAREEVGTYFLNEDDVPNCLKVIAIVLENFNQRAKNDLFKVNFHLAPAIAEAVEEMNRRFAEHRMGFEFRDGHFIRKDSNFTHAAIVSPALELLSEPYLKGAEEEFAKAQEHFRHGRFSECLNEGLKAFESTMKLICHKRGWPYNQTDTAVKLLNACKSAGLFPSYLETSLGGLRAVLENVATFRNKLSGHGQGVQQVDIDQDTASFILNSTAANILFLVSREKRLP
jgi:hypothetical protein